MERRARRETPKANALRAEYRNMKRELKRKVRGTPTLQMDLDELRELIVSMAEVARVEGIQALEGLLAEGLQLTVDGLEQEKVKSLLETQMQALLNNYGTRYRMIIGGIAASSRDNPRVVEHMQELL
ncbi:MAG TPA: hypothetical protein EYO90_08125 [Candidatus Latescibacteria bacterium]|nr:hypothetical protein [Candidatus Latescibacterota bacterium]